MFAWKQGHGVCNAPTIPTCCLCFLSAVCEPTGSVGIFATTNDGPWFLEVVDVWCLLRCPPLFVTITIPRTDGGPMSTGETGSMTQHDSAWLSMTQHEAWLIFLLFANVSCTASFLLQMSSGVRGRNAGFAMQQTSRGSLPSSRSDLGGDAQWIKGHDLMVRLKE